MFLSILQVRSFNDILQKEVEQNLNDLYDGPFQRDIEEVKNIFSII